MDLDSALNAKPAEGASALDILRADHREVSGLFDEYERAGAEPHVRRVTLQTLCMSIELHDAVERDVFYPALASTERKQIESALIDHDAVLRLVHELRERSECDGLCDAAVAELKREIERHVLEEEGALFPRAEQKGTAWLHKVGQELIGRKEELTRSTEEFEGPAT